MVPIAHALDARQLADAAQHFLIEPAICSGVRSYEIDRHVDREDVARS